MTFFAREDVGRDVRRVSRRSQDERGSASGLARSGPDGDGRELRGGGGRLVFVPTPPRRLLIREACVPGLETSSRKVSAARPGVAQWLSVTL